MRFVICYDISDNKERAKFVKILQNYGIRVQYSVFEFNLNEKKINELKKKIESKKFNTKNVNYNMYPLCKNCFIKMDRFGDNNVGYLDNDFIII